MTPSTRLAVDEGAGEAAMFLSRQVALVVCVLVCFAHSCPAAEPEGAEPADLRRELDDLRTLANELRKRIDALETRLNEADRGGGQSVKNAPSPKPVVDRDSRLGLDGYCPVTLVNEMRWLLGKPQHRASYEGCVYLFASQEQKREFEEEPEGFAPVLSGYDAVSWFDEAQPIVGHRRHGVFYSESVWLFSSEESLHRFESDPNRYLLAKAISAVVGIDAAPDLCPRERAPDPGSDPNAPEIGGANDASSVTRERRVTRRECVVRRGGRNQRRCQNQP